MGVHGLWPVRIPYLSLHDSIANKLFHCQIVNLAAKQRNFAELVIREGFESPIGVRAYRLGVDVR